MGVQQRISQRVDLLILLIKLSFEQYMSEKSTSGHTKGPHLSVLVFFSRPHSYILSNVDRLLLHSHKQYKISNTIPGKLSSACRTIHDGFLSRTAASTKWASLPPTITGAAVY